MSDLTQLFVADGTVHDVLVRVAQMSTAALPVTRFAAITMVVEGTLTTGVFTDPVASQIEQVQFDSGEGPCVDAYRSGEIRVIESTADERRWPDFCSACVRYGIGSTLSIPMTVETHTTGALNLYSREERAFDCSSVETASVFAAQAAILLASAEVSRAALARAAQLQQAMESRSSIEQAKGIVIATTRCTPDEAFAVLVTQSQKENRKLHDIAREIVEHASRRD